ncbi:DUF732 domain-containing protein [Mycobacterium arosiense]|uniref:DUF732 domain-containing protein n=1 Tax=Mycobacterium arosiense ATCC BAA-1401 = DSM 45069 TaxID=1265311 RepID=A0A1W9Z5T0_MYCAI|nr:DUF732 domain-containing protein [Mycobacterium arosiense]ORA07721.1 hypothetical protein BST14_26545 [Mycobacterium arosiense ATCC BAA-1401 = DSM 45069]
MKLFLGAAAFAAAIGMAVPAHADSTDDAFIASLDKAGITYSDSDKAVGAGKWVCTTVKGGTQMPDVVSTLQSKNSDLTEDKANKFAAIAASTYCPDQVSSSSQPTPSATASSTS